MKTLIINANPDYNGKGHYSIRMMEHFLELFHKKFPNESCDVLNLAAEEIPRATCGGGLLTIWNKQADGAALTPQEQQTANVSERLMNQFLAHHRIVIVMPMHNFNVPSIMKDYMDNILVARKTYKYVHGGSVGLMNDDRRALLLQASGSVYTNNDRNTSLEFSRMYLQEMFTTIMGFNSFQVVRAQGTSTSAFQKDPEAWNAVVKQLDEEFEKFYA